MNVILIVVDALRFDHLGIGGYGRDTSPNIDKLAKKGTIFPNAYCPLPRTDPSMMSIFTGMYPHNHGIRLVANNKADASLATLAETLKNHAYKTAFIGGFGVHDHALEKGFDDFNLMGWKIRSKIKRTIFKAYNPSNYYGEARQYTDIAVNWIRKNSKNKFFLCVHYEDLHWPYEAPKPFEHMFDPEYGGNHDFNTVNHGKFSRGELIFGKAKLPKEEIEHAIAHYDGGIRYIDAQIHRLLGCVESHGLDDDTLIILTADHGENFGEHNFYFQHGASLYEPSLKVPMILNHSKSIPRGKIISQRVRNFDIMPTVLDILGIPILDKIDGASLLPLIKGEGKKTLNFIFAESIEEHFKGNERVFFPGIKGKWRAMIEGDWKIIYIPHPKNDIFELYNLREDPQEKNDLIGKEKEIASKMKEKILDFLKPQSNEGDANITNLAEKSKKLLRKIGYLE
ncbi:sulfatase [Candidatus Woesearchaeota archaeon]|nr:sulfatase [Candidatus Woesearchaeota archaeon]